jgi:hypothetical protein
MAGAFVFPFFLLASWGIHHFLKDEGISDAGALFEPGVLRRQSRLLFRGIGTTSAAWAYLPGACALARSALETRRQQLGSGAHRALGHGRSPK